MKPHPLHWGTVCNMQSVTLDHINKTELRWIDTRTKYKLTINFLDRVSSRCYFYIMNHHFIKPTKRFLRLSALLSHLEKKRKAWNTSCLTTKRTSQHERSREGEHCCSKTSHLVSINDINTACLKTYLKIHSNTSWHFGANRYSFSVFKGAMLTFTGIERGIKSPHWCVFSRRKSLNNTTVAFSFQACLSKCFHL